MFLIPNINFIVLGNIKSMNPSIPDLDKDYCLITVERSFILCSYFRYSPIHQDKYYQIDFSSYSADRLFSLMNQHNYLSKSISLSHAFYIGREIYKAELSLILLQLYIQS